MKLPAFLRRSQSLGVALGGGGVRGAAHLGVLAVLEEEGIRPACLAGTSVGAILGAGYAAGFGAQELLAEFEKLNWFALVGPSLKLPRLNLLDTSRLERFLRQRLGLSTFSDLRIPFQAVACDLDSGETVALGEGDVVEAVMASSALPGLFPPVRRHEHLLVDGGVVNNLPVDVVRRMGADCVVGVDLLPPPTPGSQPDTLLEVWQRSLYLMIRGNQARPDEADLFVQPDVAGSSFSDFDQVPDLYRKGRLAARKLLPKLTATRALC